MQCGETDDDRNGNRGSYMLGVFLFGSKDEMVEVSYIIQKERRSQEPQPYLVFSVPKNQTLFLYRSRMRSTPLSIFRQT
jgi:hypothetical protein